ncbi:MAG: hypothetical protein K6F34_00085 [Lachnospiraceae bacterium]|nr:hypothetical protein [Lachnospiraceae bacterium]
MKTIYKRFGAIVLSAAFACMSTVSVHATQLPKVNPAPLIPQTPAVTTVEQPATPPVTVDLIIFAGQSNMSGNGGNAALAPVVGPGQGYEYRPSSAPNALFPLVEPFGRYERGYISDSPEYQNGTLVSAFVSTYYSKTGVPVVAVPATHGGTDSGYWANDATKADLLSRFVKANTYLTSNNFNVRHKYLVFLQGESDAVKGINSFDYKNNLSSAFQPLFANGLEQVFIITPGYAIDGIYSYEEVYKAQVELCDSSDLFTLGSALLHKLAPGAYLADAVHYNQNGLNLVGSNAGANVAAFAGGIK